MPGHSGSQSPTAPQCPSGEHLEGLLAFRKSSMQSATSLGTELIPKAHTFVAAAHPTRSLVWRRRDLGSNDSEDAAAMQPAVVCCGHQRMARITSIAFDTTSSTLVRNCTCTCLAGRARSCSHTNHYCKASRYTL